MRWVTWRAMSVRPFIQDGAHITLLESPTKCARDGVTPRALAGIPYAPAAWANHSCKILDAVNNPAAGYARGTCSSLVRRHGNLHGHAVELRRAAYWCLGARAPIREQYPEWDDATEQVRWVDALVAPSPGLDDVFQHLLERPMDAVRYLQHVDPCGRPGRPDGRDNDAAGDVRMRRFAAVAIVAELVTAVACWREHRPAGGLLQMTMSLAPFGGFKLRRYAAGTGGVADAAAPADLNVNPGGVAMVDLRHRVMQWPPLDCRPFKCDCCSGLFVVPAQERAKLKRSGRGMHKQCRACHNKNRQSQRQGEFMCDCGASFCISEATRARIESNGHDVYMMCTPCRAAKFEKNRCLSQRPCVFTCKCGNSITNISEITRARIESKGHEMQCSECQYEFNVVAKGPLPCRNHGCDGTFVILAGQLANLKSKNHAMPTTCIACREWRKNATVGQKINARESARTLQKHGARENVSTLPNNHAWGSSSGSWSSWSSRSSSRSPSPSSSSSSSENCRTSQKNNAWPSEDARTLRKKSASARW